MSRILFLLLCAFLGNTLCVSQSTYILDVLPLITIREEAVITDTLLSDYLEYQLVPFAEDSRSKPKFMSLYIDNVNDSIYPIIINFDDSTLEDTSFTGFYHTKIGKIHILISLKKPVPFIKGLGRKKEYRFPLFDDEYSRLELSLTKDSLKLDKIDNHWGCLMTVPDEKLKPGLYRDLGDKPVANPRLQSIEDLYYRPVSIIHLNTTLTEILKEQNLSKASKKHKRPRGDKENSFRSNP